MTERAEQQNHIDPPAPEGGAAPDAAPSQTDAAPQTAPQTDARAAAPSPGAVPVVAVVLAAGFGTRFDPDNPKQLVSVGGMPIVCRSIAAFESDPLVTDIIVVVNPRVRSHVEALVDAGGFPKVRAIIDGGRERADSTCAALDTLAAYGIPARAKLLIHDAVRPFVSRASIDGCIAALDECNAATVAIPSTDTILLTRDAGERKVIDAVPDRPDSFRAQTPQAFRFGTLRRAYDLAAADPAFHPTDDTRVVVDYLPDEAVAIVPGSESNIKITTPDDLPQAERLAQAQSGAASGAAGAASGVAGVVPDGMPASGMTREEAKARMHALFAAVAPRAAR